MTPPQEAAPGRETDRPATASRVVSRVGSVLSLLALGWIGWKIAGEAGPLLAALSWRLGLALLAGAALYSLLGGLLATAWWWLSRVHGDRPGVLPAVAVWSRSQFAKYLPGNVFHYVSRQLFGRRLGLRHETLVAGHLLETLSLFLAAGLLAALALATGGVSAGLASSLRGGPWLALVALAVALLVAWPLLDRLARRLPLVGPRLADLPHLGWRRSLALLGPVLSLHLAFFVGTASLLHLADFAWQGGTLPWPETVWIYAVAWSLGTVTPGAPGGLGVREAALTLGLGELAGVEPAYAAGIALALRVVTVLGDLLLYLAALRVPLPDETSDDHPEDLPTSSPQDLPGDAAAKGVETS